MATKKNGNGKKRLSPSVERQIALALVAVLERTKEFFTTPICGFTAIMSSPGPENAEAEIARSEGTRKLAEALRASVDESHEILKANGYDDLESIASRVAALENQLTAAISLRDGKEISRLGAALDRAKSGKPPLVVVEKKPKTASAERKPRIAKAVKDILEAFDNETLADGEGRVVTSIKADESGKGCLVQFQDDATWTSVEPSTLKPLTAAKGSDAPVQTTAS